MYHVPTEVRWLSYRLRLLAGCHVEKPVTALFYSSPIKTQYKDDENSIGMQNTLLNVHMNTVQMNSSAKDVTTYNTENVETQHRQLEQGMQQCSNKWWMAGATMLHVLHATKAKKLLPLITIFIDILPWKT